MSGTDRGPAAPLIAFDATPLEVRQPSGVSRYTADLLRALVARHDPWRLACVSSRPVDEAVLAGTEGRLGGTFPNRWLWMQIVLPRILARSRPSLCHFTNYLAPLRCPVPYVLTIFDLSLFLFPQTQTVRNRLLVRTLLPAVTRRARAVVTTSEVSRAHIISVLGAAPHRVHVVRGSTTAAFHRKAGADDFARVRSRYDLEGPYVLAVGTLEPRKNLPRLVQAFGALRRQGRAERLVLVGQRGWKYRAVFDFINRERLGDAVVLTGYVPEADLPALYGAAAAVAFPSLHEGFGLPALEALACGAVLVTSKGSAMEEIAGGAAIYVDPTDAGSIASGLRSALDDRELRARLHEEGPVCARQFTWAAVAERTARVYEEVLAFPS